jgi:RimJ/RimL family protein N-acetyltransferase
MGRLLKILWSQMKGLSPGDFLAVMRDSLLKNDPILVYGLNLSKLSETTMRNSTISVRPGRIEDLEESRKSMDGPLPWEFQCDQYDGVKDFFVACEGKQIRHISWIYHHDDPNRILRLDQKDAEIKYCLTLPGFRGQGLYPRVLEAVAHHLRSKGANNVFICVHEENRSSVKGIEKAGFKRVGSLRLRKVMGFQVSRRLAPSENC